MTVTGSAEGCTFGSVLVTVCDGGVYTWLSVSDCFDKGCRHDFLLTTVLDRGRTQDFLLTTVFDEGCAQGSLLTTVSTRDVHMTFS